MRLDTLAWLSLKRQQGRAIWLVASVTLTAGTLLFLYLVSTTMNLQLANAFDAVGANITVFPAGQASLTYGGVPVGGDPEAAYLTNDAIIAINSIENRENVAYIAPKVFGVVSMDRQQVLVVGVDFPAELGIKKWWRFSGRKPAGVDDLLLGSRAAERLGVAPGDSLPVKGRAFRVAGVLEPQGNEEDDLVFMQLLAAQQLLGLEDKLSFIEVAAYCTTCPIDQIMAQIREKLPGARVTALAETVQARRAVVDRFNRLAVGVAVAVGVVGALVVLLLMLTSVSERTREIGIFRTVGFRRWQVLEVVLTEVLLVSLAGGALAFLAGTWLAQLAGPRWAGMSLAIGWDPLLGGLTMLVAVGIGVLAGLYPAWRAANLDPVEAVRPV